jgi:NADPH-dependent glutamate synthase beta subunit-like oxidoreductase/ferredoxin
MPKLSIDAQPVEVPQGATILDAASKLGIDIPTMCFLKGFEPSTSCMVCVVKVRGKSGLVPACGSLAEDGMVVETSTPEILEARKTALELLLSDHVGDCMGPCQIACPAHMNIPLMIRQIAAGRLTDAVATVKKDIALPAVLGRICPAPCENACRRSQADGSVAICLLKRYIADVDLQSSQTWQPECKPKLGKSVAIVGAGPAGLAAAYHLLAEGISCIIYDDHEQMGGALGYAVSEHDLPRDVLDAEIATITDLGLNFIPRTTIGRDISIAELKNRCDAVFIATGPLKNDDLRTFGLKATDKGISIDRQTYATSAEGIFAGGDTVRSRKLAVRAVADGKEAAAAIAQYLRDRPVTGPDRPFNTRMGRLLEGEMPKFLAASSPSPRITPAVASLGFSDRQAKIEAARCLHCDCRKAENCTLRTLSKAYSASATSYKSARRTFEQRTDHPLVIFEPGKCIDCGLCIQIAAQHRESLGLTFIARGFSVRVAVPFDKPLSDALHSAARQCVEACPTGAIALKDE